MKLHLTNYTRAAVAVGSIAMLLSAPLVFAQGTIANVPIQRVGPGTVGGLVDLLRAIVRWTYIVFFILGVFFILVAAFTYLFARGDEAKVKTARNMLLYAAVAFIVAFLAVGFETIIGTFLTNPSA
mgnify:FL=1